jgi:hypothetical protein
LVGHISASGETQAMQASTIDSITYGVTRQLSLQTASAPARNKVKENGVYVDSLYYPEEHGKLNHEYQLDYCIPESVECCNRTLAFLAKVTPGKQSRR